MGFLMPNFTAKIFTALPATVIFSTPYAAVFLQPHASHAHHHAAAPPIEHAQRHISALAASYFPSWLATKAKVTSIS